MLKENVELQNDYKQRDTTMSADGMNIRSISNYKTWI